MRIPRLLQLVGLLLSAAPVLANQQYEGDEIPNEMPSIAGSEIAYFRIKDPSDAANQLTLINYQSLQADGSPLDPALLQRAVIMLHGLEQDPERSMAVTLDAFKQQMLSNNTNINSSSVAIMAPFFPIVKQKKFPWSDGDGSSSTALVWKDSAQWASGGNNLYPKGSTSISSFDVIDQLIRHWDDRTAFPNIKHIVVAGHAGGADAIARYVQIGNSFKTSSRVTFWMGSPNSFPWLDTTRPISNKISTCLTYDNWPDGYAKYTKYPMTYGTSLVASGRKTIIANMKAKNKIYVWGMLDDGDSSTRCNTYTTGQNRAERLFNFFRAWPPTCESQKGHCDLVDYVQSGNDAAALLMSPAGRARIFTDNFYGDGKTAFDFGYPRNQRGDDPYPDPKSAEPNRVYYDTRSYTAKQMRWAGCWTDDHPSTRTFKYLAYESEDNTVPRCTRTCASQGYKIAAMEYGSQCFCGNTLSAYAAQTANIACSKPCAGNATQTCGNSYRLSVYSAGAMQRDPIPRSPPVVNPGNYRYQGCMMEPKTGARLLDKAGYSNDTSMGLGRCAFFCRYYKYFGTEYASQCFCADSYRVPPTKAPAADCGAICTGNKAQLCGGGNRLSVYMRA